jgi:hypothetical protein
MRHGQRTRLITTIFLVCVVERLEDRFFLVIVVLSVCAFGKSSMLL